MDSNQTPAKFRDQQERLIANLSSGQPEIIKAHKMIPSTNSTKDSGIGTTYLTVSSASSSNNTSPESEKDALAQNGKVPKPLSISKIDATSTPAAASKPPEISRISEESLVETASDTPKVISNGTAILSPRDRPKLAFSITDQLGSSTPYVSRKRVRSIRTNQLAEHERQLNTPWAVPESGKRVQVGTKGLTEPIRTDMESSSGRRRQRRMHQCEHCEKQFDRPSLLKRHTLTHTGERPFECRFCSKGFSTRSGVNTHERTHTGQRPYVCRVCGRRFAAGSNLIFHKYTHSNTRRHQCSQCPKAFVTPGDLRKHEYTHTGQWPFRCTICDRGFATERNLKSHEVTHTGEKPFSCPVCHKGYAQESSMKTHLRTHQKPLSDDGDNIDARRKTKLPENSFPTTHKLTETSSRPAAMPPLQENFQLIKCGSPRQYTASPRTYSAPSMTSLNSDITSPVLSRVGNDQLCAPNTRLRSDPHQNSAFTTPPRISKGMEPTIPHGGNAREFSWFYERYRAYYQYYINNLANTAPVQQTNVTSPVTLPSTVLHIQSIPASPPCMWSPVTNVTGVLAPSSFCTNQFNTIISPETSFVAMHNPNPTSLRTGFPSANQNYSQSHLQQNPISQMPLIIDHNSTSPTENGALDYTLTTLSKLQQPTRRG
ncbi:Zinc finger protein [Fasciola hepatica]|uniref:Zinc finger protein n=1 Tax=Fasciola hepatica TaxID=6192 RepID=A0A2H1CA67_FASHE|nr:Zinc finger protein [Fasciola hepatica]